MTASVVIPETHCRSMRLAILQSQRAERQVAQLDEDLRMLYGVGAFDAIDWKTGVVTRSIQEEMTLDEEVERRR